MTRIRTRTSTAAAVLAATLVTGCASSARRHGPGIVRYQVAPPVTLVNDRRPTPPPSKFDEGLVQYYLDQELIAPTRRLFSVPDDRHAQNVNSLGEVPDSTWFTNRHVGAEEIRRGPGIGGPDRSKPWRVVGVKAGGAAIGITVRDGRGDRYVIKFDQPGHAETESSADVIVQRLAWAMGYNVPDNEVVTFPRSALVLDPEAKFQGLAGAGRKMVEADLDTYLKLAESDHGTYRALASRFIAGKIVGGVEPEGTRSGDVNDLVPHELRRDLRGQRLLWAWLNHIDLKSQNTLAAYDDHHVTWYVLDFGESLGVASRTDDIPRLGYRTKYSAHDWFLSLVTFGFYVHPWERRAARPPYRGLGDFDADTFDPAHWVPDHSWRPTDLADRFDELWAAERILAFTRADIEAAVAAGQYSDARTSKYLVETLLARQRKIGAYALDRVAPLTTVHVDGARVCFDDLWLRYGYGDAAATTYRALSYDYDGNVIGAPSAWTAATGPSGCVPISAAPGGSHDGYTIARVEVRRGHHELPPLFVHVARGPSGPLVVGLDRR